MIMKTRIIGIIFTIVFLSSCKKDFRDSIVGNYKVINEYNDCQYTPSATDSTVDTIRISKSSGDDNAIIMQCRSFTETMTLYSQNLPLINNMYLNWNSTFGRENYILYLSSDSICFMRGRYVSCRGGNFYYRYFGHKI